MTYLTSEIKVGLKKYKYACVDTSPFSRYIMHPFWNWLVQFSPLWVAPNLLTFIGFMISLLTFLLISVYNFDYLHPTQVPSWIWLLSGLFVFIAYTLDGIDGKQARRTGTSSALGELLDHGCDSLTCTLLPSSILSLFGAELTPWTIFLITFLMIWGFALSHWEKCITGILFLPWAFDVGQVMASVLLIITSAVTPRFWSTHILFGYSYTDLAYVLALIGIFLFMLPSTAYNVYISYKEGTGRNPSFISALRPLTTLTIFTISTVVWIMNSPTNILQNHLRLLIVCIGFISSNVICNIILAQVSLTESPIWNTLTAVFITATGLVVFLPSSISAFLELFILRIVTVFSILAHLHYSTILASEIEPYFPPYMLTGYFSPLST